MKDIFVLLDNSFNKDKKSYLFTEPQHEIICTQPEDLKQSFEDLEQLQKDNYHCLGYITYECGYFFQNIPHSYKKDQPLVHFYAFTNKTTLDDQEVARFLSTSKDEPPSIFDFELSEDFASYQNKINKIHNQQRLGNTYQVNYTLGAHFSYNSHPFEIYKKLRKQQPVEYGAYLNFPEAQFLSFSPELFFKIENGQALSKPMKGTRKRPKEKELEKAIKDEMKSDEKTIAENLMIVDMIRNDFSQIAEPGSVKASPLFEIEEYKTVFQMTSSVSAQIKNSSLYNIFHKIFPCASITGAPKKRTMKIIKDLEEQERDIYTGAIGWLKPQGDMIFNVPIRTLTLKNKHSGSMGVGGGILIDSIGEDEYQECLDKTSFIKHSNNDFYIIESLLYKDNKIPKIEEHLQRLSSSCKTFSFPLNKELIKKSILEKIKSLSSDACKIRIEAYNDGLFSIKEQKILAPEKDLKIDISSIVLKSTSLWLKHKTSHREIYNKEWIKAQDLGFYDRIFFNEKSEVTESCRHNIFIEIDKQLYTPPLSSGVLPGVYRDQLLQRGAKEKVLYKEDLLTAEKIYLCNSVRELVEVHLS